MYLADCHMHSAYSYDGHETVDDLCREAIKKGLDEIAVTDHYDLFAEQRYAHDPDFESLFRDIKAAREAYAGKLKVSAGIELGQPQIGSSSVAVFLKRYKPDFVIGSIHNLEDAYDVGDYDFTQKDSNSVYIRYLEFLNEMAESMDFDVCGHIPCATSMSSSGIILI